MATVETAQRGGTRQKIPSTSWQMVVLCKLAKDKEKMGKWQNTYDRRGDYSLIQKKPLKIDSKRQGIKLKMSKEYKPKDHRKGITNEKYV